MDTLPQLLEALLRHVNAARSAPADLDAAESETFDLLHLTLSDYARGDGPAPLAATEASQLLSRLEAPRHAWAEPIREALLEALGPSAPDDRPILHRLEVGRRMLATHFFMEGQAPSRAHFAGVEVHEDGDIQVGIGLRLSDGSLPRFLSNLARTRGFDAPRLALRPFFDFEADALADAILEGTDAVSDFLRSQLIHRYDPNRRRIVAHLPDAWAARFDRLATSLPARRLQLELAAGARLTAARTLAERHRLESMRGLALAFDLQPILQRIPSESRRHTSSEFDRLNTLADSVLERVHGSAYQHWSQRVQALVEGQGWVARRRYTERDYLGPDAVERPWRFIDAEPLDQAGFSVSPAAIPLPGRDYVVQAEDQLSRIARRAYHGKADYRYILEANPHLDSPAHINPGTRIFLPHWPPQRASEITLSQLARERVNAHREHDRIALSGRTLGPFPDPDEQARLDTIQTRLRDLYEDELPTARASLLPEGWAILVQGRLTIQLIDADMEIARERFPDHLAPLEAWAHELAAELRGDVILGPEHHLTLGLHPFEVNRRRWVRAALSRAITEETLDPITLRALESGLSFEILDSTDCALVRLTQEDFDAIRKQPGRRLVDLPMPPTRFNELAAILWISDLRGDKAELVVPPIQQLRRFNQRSPSRGQLDILAPMGTPVFPMAPGHVTDCVRRGPSHEVHITHPGGLLVRYLHLATLTVRAGQDITADTLIGRSGLSIDTREPCITLHATRGGRPVAPESLVGTFTREVPHRKG